MTVMLTKLVKLGRAIAILHIAQRGLCAGCGQLVRQKKGRPNPLAPSFDHIIPRSKGGWRTLENGLLKHRACNIARGDKPASGCDLIWQQAVFAVLAAATSAIDAELRKSREINAAEAAEAERVQHENALRTIIEHNGARYRLWGVVRRGICCKSDQLQ